jgi:type II secretory pathway component PulF
MKKFFYKAKINAQENTEGVITASSSEEAYSLISRRGHIPVSIQELKSGASSSRSGVKAKKRPPLGWKKDLTSLTRQLSVLTRAGIPVVRGLDILSSQRKGSFFGVLLEDISERIRNGGTLSEGMGAHQEIFSNFYRAMVKAGEESGTLDKSLEMLSDYFKKQSRLMARVRSAMAYPAFIGVVGLATVVFIFSNVMPRIIPVLTSFDVPLPVPTKVIFFLSDFFREEWFWILLAVLIFSLMFKKALGNKVFVGHISAIRLRLPVFGDLILKAELSRFTRALEICLKSGIPAVNATAIALSLVNEPYIKERMSGLVKSIEKGRALSETFTESGIFPDFAINLINVGEESGDLAGSMADISDSFETDCSDAIEVSLGLLEPVMVLIVGLVVGFIVSAVLLPVFQMNFLGV